MSWPTPQDYNEAIQNPKQSFRDVELMAGRPELTSLGLPRPITGNFASVYRLHCGRRDWAVRCFWREYADMADRYRAIADHLAASKLPYTVGFEYLAQGIQVRGRWYPILKMEWVEGELLSEFIQKHLADAAVLSALAERWLEMMRALEAASIAHGDLQHGNVLVVNGRLKLVDYDGMYVPTLAGRPSHELGHQNYQHPARSAADFGPYLDHFSAWIIYITLVALSSRPEAWTQADGGDECLLLRKHDFELPADSSILTSLRQAGDEQLRHLIARVPAYVSLAPRQVPPVSSLSSPAPASGNEVRRRLASLFGGSTSAPASLPSGEVVPAPAWLTDVMTPRAEDRLDFASAPTLPRAFVRVSGAALVASILAAIVSLRALIPTSAIFSLLIVTCNLAVTVVFFGRDPHVVEKRALLKRRRYHFRQLQAIQQGERALEARKAAARADHDRKMIALAERRSGLKGRESDDRQAAEAAFRSRLIDIEANLEQLDRAQEDALTAALKVARERHMNEALKRRSLWAAQISGLDLGARVQLWLAGVRTACDVDSTHVGALKRLGRERAAALLTWRLGIERELRHSVPRRLPPADKTAAMAQFEAQRERLCKHRASIDARRGDVLDAIYQYYNRKYSRVDAEIVRAAKDYSAECLRLQSVEAEIHTDEPVHGWQLHQIDRELTRYENISLRQYFLALVGGWGGALSWGRQRPD